MTERDRACIGHVVRFGHTVEAQFAGDGELHLLLGRRTAAGEEFLDLPRCVMDDGDLPLGGGEQVQVLAPQRRGFEMPARTRLIEHAHVEAAAHHPLMDESADSFDDLEPDLRIGAAEVLRQRPGQDEPDRRRQADRHLAGDIAEAVRGPLDVGCLATFAQVVLPGLRRSFEARYPDVRVRQHEGHQGELVVMLQRGEIDAALTYDMALAQDVAFEPLVELPPYVMLAEGHPLAGRAELTPRDLADEPMVLHLVRG